MTQTNQNNLKVHRLPMAVYTGPQAQAISYIYGGADALGFNTGEVQYQFTPDASVLITPNSPLLAMQINNEAAWIEIPEQLLASFILPSFPELDLKSIPKNYLSLVAESGSAWILDWLESLTSWRIAITHCEQGNKANDIRRQIKRKTAKELTPISFRVQDSNGLNCAMNLYLSNANLTSLAQMMPKASVARQILPNDLPIPYSVHIGMTQLSQSETESLQIGDVLVVEKTLLNRERVGMILSDDTHYTAMIHGDTIKIESIGYDVMSTTNNHDALAVNVTFELSRSRLPLEQLNRLAPGSVLKVGKDLQAPIDLYANGKRIAIGDLVDMDGTVAVRISQIL